MIAAEPILDYGKYRIDKYTYFDCPPDCANCGNDRISYEVIDNTANDMIEAFETADEAIQCAENQIMWDWCLFDKLPYEVQGEKNNAMKSLLIWFISNTQWIAKHEGEQGVDNSNVKLLPK